MCKSVVVLRSTSFKTTILSRMTTYMGKQKTGSEMRNEKEK
jgi:hypothetical protein